MTVRLAADTLTTVSHRGWALVIVAIVVAPACGGGRHDTTPLDASTPDATGTVTPPASPAEPALPALGPCPAGWTEARPGEAVTCEPWPAGGASACAAGEARFPGDAACAPVGGACPTGDFASDLPTDRPVLYVRAGANGGNGSLGAPFGRIGEALLAAAPGAVVALSKGTFDEVVAVQPGVTLWGACAAQTRIASSLPSEDSAVIAPRGMDVELRNLQIGGDRIGIWVADFTSVRLDSVVIDGTHVFGVLVAGGALTGRDVLIRGVMARADGRFGRGLDIEVGGNAELERVSIESCRDSAVLLTGKGSSLVLRDGALRATRSRAAAPTGTGLEAQAGTSVTLERVLVEDNESSGVFVAEAGGSLDAHDLVVRGTRQIAGDPSGGVGLRVQAGASVRVSRAWIAESDAAAVLVSRGSLELEDAVISDAGDRGLFVQYEAGSATLTRVEIARASGVALAAGAAGASIQASDIVVLDTEDGSGSAGDTIARAILAQDGATIAIERIRAERLRDAAALAAGLGSLLTITDATFRDVLPGTTASGDMNAHGAQAQEGARIELSRALIERAQLIGLSSLGDGSALVASDVVVRDIPGIDVVGGGSCVEVGGGASIDLERVHLDRCTGAGILADGVARDEGSGAAISMMDISITDTRSVVATGKGGHGMQISRGTAATGARIAIRGTRETGVLAVGEGTTVALRDLEVRGTLQRECAMTTCAGAGGGTGVVSMLSASVTIEGFVVADNALCGVQLSGGGTMDLHRGSIERNPVGVNVQTDGFDFARLTDGVEFRDNARNVDSTALPLPEAL